MPLRNTFQDRRLSNLKTSPSGEERSGRLKRLTLIVAVLVIIGFGGSASGGPKLLLGADYSDKLSFSVGASFQISSLLHSITSFDMNLSEGEKKLEPMIAALFRLPIPGRFKLGPILGPEIEHTDEGTFTGEALTYIKGAVGIVGSFAFNKEATSGLVAYYKAAIKLDDALTAPLGPSFGGRLFFDMSLLSGGG